MCTNQHLSILPHNLENSHKFSNKAANGIFSLWALSTAFWYICFHYLNKVINKGFSNAWVMCLIKPLKYFRFLISFWCEKFTILFHFFLTSILLSECSFFSLHQIKQLSHLRTHATDYKLSQQYNDRKSILNCRQYGHNNFVSLNMESLFLR